MQDEKDPKAVDSAESDADAAGEDWAAAEDEAARTGGAGPQPMLRNVALKLADLIAAPLTAGAGPQAIPIPGTDFTEAGVRRLLRVLAKRSETPGAPGRILARWLLAFLTKPTAGEESLVAGASLTQLQRLATVLDRIRAQQTAPAASQAATHGDDDPGDAADAERRRIESIEASLNRLQASVEQLAEKLDPKPTPSHRKTQKAATKQQPEG